MKFDPKTILPWIKTNWVPVSMGAAVVLLVPGAVYYSTFVWGPVIQQRAQKDVAEIAKDLKGKNLVYTPGDVQLPGVPKIEFTYPPNEQVIKSFASYRQRLADESKKVIDEIVAVNKLGRKPLVEGLLPEPGKGEEGLKRREMARRYAEAPAELLIAARAGGPKDPAGLETDLKQLRVDTENRVKEVGTTEIQDPVKIEEINKQLWQARVERIKSDARQKEFYVLPGALRQGTIPDEPTLAECFDFQQRAWVWQDVLGIISAANAGASEPGVPGAVVKRLESVQIDDVKLGADSAAGVAPAPAGTSEARTSVTGRAPHADLYDARYVTVSLVVSAARQPVLLAAVGKGRLASVIDYDTESLSVIDEFRQGYYFGDEPVVRVVLRLETLWLRDWVKPLMPPEVRTALGLGEPGDAAPVPAVPTPPRRAGARG